MLVHLFAIGDRVLSTYLWEEGEEERLGKRRGEGGMGQGKRGKERRGHLCSQVLFRETRLLFLSGSGSQGSRSLLRLGLCHRHLPHVGFGL